MVATVLEEEGEMGQWAQRVTGACSTKPEGQLIGQISPVI